LCESTLAVGGVSLKVIPVIDILNGEVVHAVKGKRDEYKPLVSLLVNSTDPVEVALAFRNLGFSELYLADLDAITGKNADFSVVKRIFEKTRLGLWVDAGFTDLKRVEEALTSKVSKVVIGTETLQSISFVKEATQRYGKARIMVSLDMVREKIVSRVSGLQSTEPLVFARELAETGIDQFILLDLLRVGSEEGVNFNIAKALARVCNIKLYLGGGVRSLEELLELRRVGAAGVLLATSLHSGRISIRELKRYGFVKHSS
jgi:phosphoribosylformimino-5-aminoimidazole carboxamide ribotide isomerase